MQKIANYNILEKIAETSHSLILRARGENSHQTVIIKTFNVDYPTASEMARFKQEYNIIKNLDIDGVVKHIELINYKNGYAIVLEDFHGVSLNTFLKNNRFDLPQFLSMAIQLVKTLGELHQRQIIHKDIKPQNIIIHPKTRVTKITDFGLSSDFTHEKEQIYNKDIIHGTLTYMSPEQTGRMNRSVDYRTDIYSLGITFYEVLTGDVPFKSDDPLEIIHAHIARQPEALNKVNQDIPEVLAGIIMKMIAKTAEERYQNCLGILVDLKICKDQLEKTGKIDAFEIASKDIPIKFNVPQILIGRENEVELLINSFERVSNGNNEMMLVSGHPGIGKSALVHEIHKPIVAKRGYFISGKYDQTRSDLPYSSILQAFKGLLRQLLAENEERIHLWKERLLQHLGPNGKIITDVIPEVELIIGKQPKVAELGSEETYNRFNLVFTNFISVFSTAEHPLVMFLDDVQWADSASHQMIKAIVTAPNINHLYMICAYRDNEVDESHPLNITMDVIRETDVRLSTIYLKPLRLSHVNSLVSNFLRCPEYESEQLSQLIYNKTQGNPFFVNQFFKTLYDNKMITMDIQKGWKWDYDKINTLQITDNVVELMTEKIVALPENIIDLLKTCACLGNFFDLGTLSAIMNRPLDKTINDLTKAIEEGLIFHADDNYRFHHDRIQEAAYSLIPENIKIQMHHNIGTYLLKNVKENELKKDILYIINHLNLGKALLKNQNEKYRLAELNLMSTTKALASAAYKSAQNYSNISLELIGNNCWENNYSLSLAIHNQAAKAAYLNTEYQYMEQLSVIILKNTMRFLDKVEIYETMMHANIAQGKLTEALDLGVETLKKLGFNLPQKPKSYHIIIGMLNVRLAYSKNKIEKILDLKKMKNPHYISGMSIMAIMGAIAYRVNPKFWLNLCFVVAKTQLRNGNSSVSPYSFMAYAAALCTMNNINIGYQFGEVALKIISRSSRNRYDTRACFVMNCYIRHWKEPLKDTIQHLDYSYQLGLDTGDLEFTTYSLLIKGYHLFISGNNLDDLENTTTKHLKTMRHLNQKANFNLCSLHHQVILNLRSGTDNPVKLSGPSFNEDIIDKHLTVLVSFYKLMLSYLFGEHKAAIDHARMAKRRLDSLRGLAFLPLLYLFETLALFSEYDKMPRKKQKVVLKKIDKNINRMEQWAKHSPENQQHRLLLFQAERFRILDKPDKAMKYYDMAIDKANENQYLQDEGIANEIAAKFWIHERKSEFASIYMTKAYHCFLRWGAKTKTQQMERDYSEYLHLNQKIKGPLSDASYISGSTNNIDLNSIIKTSQAISSEIEIDKLLKQIMRLSIENAGAQKGYLLLIDETGQDLYIAAEGSLEKEISAFQYKAVAESDTTLPLTIINYVQKMDENVVLDDAKKDSRFLNDPYIVRNQLKSILCAPIKNKGKMVGIIYLENNLATNVFTPDRLSTIQLFSSQAAISIDNAILYRNLRQEEEKYRTILKSIEDGYFESDLRGNYTFVNESLCRMFGYSKEEILRLSYKNLTNEKDAKEMSEISRKVSKTGKASKGYEAGGVRKDGSTFIADLSISLIKDSEGKQIGFRGVLRDVTDRKKKEIAEMKREAAEETSKSKSEFLANMSHEIRTPLNGILGMAGLLLDTSLDEEQNDYAKTIHYSGDALLTILNDILDFSKIEAGKLEFEVLDFDLRSAIEEMVDLLAIKAHEKGLTFGMFIHHDVPSYLRGDPGRIRQIITNLIGNAVKFTQTGEVVLNILAESETDSHVTLKVSVTDTGKGIPKEHMNRLFESFSQVDSSDSRKFGGTGLGLSISKRLTELMGGQIGVESEVSKGSTFWFSVTLEKQSVDQAMNSQIPMDIRDKRILAVDSNETTRDILDSHLNAIGCRYKVVSNFQDAIAQITLARNEQDLFHLVFIDHTLSDFDDQTILKTINSDPELKDTLLVMLTTFGMRGDAARVREMGFAGYLTKPIKTSQLHDCLSRLLSKLHQPDESASKPEFVTRYTLSEGKKRNVRILIADDNIVNQKLGLRLLQKAGYHADAVANGKEAIDALKQKDYDLILMDINMPEMDGLEATKKIRNARSKHIRKDIPIIAMTAQAMGGDKEECLQAGMNDYISKPINPQLMFQVIEKYSNYSPPVIRDRTNQCHLNSNKGIYPLV